jgi:hypothetical protein
MQTCSDELSPIRFANPLHSLVVKGRNELGLTWRSLPPVPDLLLYAWKEEMVGSLLLASIDGSKPHIIPSTDVVTMNLLKVFLEVGNVVIDELSRNQPPAPSERKRRPLKISTDLLLTLGALQPIGTPENPLKVIPMYDEVMYGCLDIVVATGSEADLIGILDEILKLNLQGEYRSVGPCLVNVY